MIWVGGGIIVHGLAELRPAAVEQRSTKRRLPPPTRCRCCGAVEWIVTAAGAGIVGLVIGAALIPLIGFVLAPAWKALKRAVREGVRL